MDMCDWTPFCDANRQTLRLISPDKSQLVLKRRLKDIELVSNEKDITSPRIQYVHLHAFDYNFNPTPISANAFCKVSLVAVIGMPKL